MDILVITLDMVTPSLIIMDLGKVINQIKWVLILPSLIEQFIFLITGTLVVSTVEAVHKQDSRQIFLNIQQPKN